jgi:uncharacterized protein YdaU (DUF1376 family)
MHYYNFNIGDFIKDSAHLSLEEEAIYRRLIDLYYTSEKPIQLDIKLVSRSIRARGHEELIEQILLEFFNRTEKGFKQKRIDLELKKYREKSQKAANSANARWNKGSNGCERIANAKQTHSEGNANHKPITNNHKPITNKEIVIPEGINIESWNEWFTYRKEKKKTVSQAAAKKQFNLLAKYTTEQQKLIIDTSIQNDYQGLFEPKVNNNEAHKRVLDEQDNINWDDTSWADNVKLKL